MPAANLLEFSRRNGGPKELVNVSTGNNVPTAAGTTDDYIIAPQDGFLESVDFSANEAMAASDTNYVSFSVINLAQDGTGSANLLSTGPENTTKATGGTALVAGGKRSLSLATGPNKVSQGDRLRMRITGTGTLPNGLTGTAWCARFN